MNDDHRIIVVLEEPNTNPYELWMITAMFISGLVFIVGLAPAPSSLQANLPHTSIFLWNLQLLSGALAIIIGMFWKQPTTGRTIQIAGHVWTATGALIYASVLFYYNGVQAMMAGLIVGGIVVAAVTRALQLQRQIKYIIQKVGERNGAANLDDNSGGD